MAKETMVRTWRPEKKDEEYVGFGGKYIDAVRKDGWQLITAVGYEDKIVYYFEREYRGDGNNRGSGGNRY